jgi:hypothetical protein
MAEFGAADRHRCEQGRRGLWADACGGGALAHRGQLDSAGHGGLELLVGPALPLQPLSTCHEHVQAALADSLLPSGKAAVTVHPGGDPGGMGLSGDGGRQAGGCRAREADVPGAAAGLEQGGDDEHDGHRHDHQGDRGEKGPRPGPLADLPPGHQPALPHPVHAATASRNSSDNVGGW